MGNCGFGRAGRRAGANFVEKPSGGRVVEAYRGESNLTLIRSDAEMPSG